VNHRIQIVRPQVAILVLMTRQIVQPLRPDFHMIPRQVERPIDVHVPGPDSLEIPRDGHFVRFSKRTYLHFKVLK
jgi:hypothetical protein